MGKIKNVEVREKFDFYPNHIREKLLLLRKLVIDTASETSGVGELEETLKWGEPSYLAKGGSTIRINWKESSPTNYFMYFHCKTKLVDVLKSSMEIILSMKETELLFSMLMVLFLRKS